MEVGLHDAELDHMQGKIFPNYAIMKLGAYHKARGDRVAWWQPLCRYDKVYSSKVFTYSPDNLYLPEDAVLGGTGNDIRGKLPDEVDAVFPDYSLYPSCDYAIGYLTRGCPNKCRWCCVPEKEGPLRPYRTWPELVRADSDQLVLLDNNILASDHGLGQMEELSRTPYQIDLNQGMDARLVTPEVAALLARLKWIRFLRFSCDCEAQIPHIQRTVELLAAQGLRPYHVFVYLLVTHDIPEASRRVNALRGYTGIHLYAQPERNLYVYEKPSAVQQQFVRFIYGRTYNKESWEQYAGRHGLPASEEEAVGHPNGRKGS